MGEGARSESPRNTFDSVMSRHRAIYDAINGVLSTDMETMSIEERKRFFLMLETELQGVLDKINDFK